MRTFLHGGVFLASKAIREQQLDQLAPKIASEFAGLQSKVNERQSQLGSEAEATAGSTSTMTLAISGLLIVIGLVLAWIVGRLIAGAIRRMAGAMQALVSGDNKVVIEGAQYQHELGAMARSLQSAPPGPRLNQSLRQKMITINILRKLVIYHVDDF